MGFLDSNGVTRLCGDLQFRFAPNIHQHAASNITSGTLAIARIPTGTTSSTVALGNHTHSGYQDTLVSGTNIKTVNSQSLLGSGDLTISEGTEMVVLAYGKSTWADFEAVYPNAVVYCRASSNSNPASGAQTRMAFMAYVNSEDAPTEVEFQYYRSVSTKSATQQGDQVFVYKLNKTNGWSVTTREAYTRITAGTGMTQSYSGGVLTLQAPRELPTVTSSDNGKVLGVVDGAWAAMSSGGGGVSILTLYANGGMNTLYIDAGLTTELMDYYGYDKEAAYEDLSSFDIVKVVNLINGNQKTCVVSCIDWDSVEEELVLSIVSKSVIAKFEY